MRSILLNSSHNTTDSINHEFAVNFLVWPVWDICTNAGEHIRAAIVRTSTEEEQNETLNIEMQ